MNIGYVGMHLELIVMIKLNRISTASYSYNLRGVCVCECVVRLLKLSLSEFQVHNLILLIIVTTLYI